MPVSGATVSTVQVWVAGVASTLSATSTARTLSVWAPSARLLTWSGDSQAAYSPLSSLHSSRFTPESASAPANVRSADVAFVAAGGPSTVVVGAILSSLTSCWMWAAELAALSAQVPLEVTRRLAVSWVTTTSATSSVAMPDWTVPVSSQFQATVTSLRFQPAALGAGVRPADVMRGRVISIRIVEVTGIDTQPAKSVQPPDVKSVPVVSVVTVPPPVAGSSTLEPGIGSSQLKLSFVAVLFQP